MHFQTFFGGANLAIAKRLLLHTDPSVTGHTAEWASPKDQRAWFSDISGVIIK
jgi:hypothetical protein